MKPKKPRSVEELMEFLTSFTAKLRERLPKVLDNVSVYSYDASYGKRYQLIHASGTWYFFDTEGKHADVVGCLMGKWNVNVYGLLSLLVVAGQLSRAEDEIIREHFREETRKQDRERDIDAAIRKMASAIGLTEWQLRAKLFPPPEMAKASDR